jgi:hypothetical protein
LFDEYCTLKKNRKAAWEKTKMKVAIFKGELKDLFDIVTMTIEDDKNFLVKQREKLSSASFSGIDQTLKKKEDRKRQRLLDERKRKE